MTLFLLLRTLLDGQQVIGVFSTREKAEQFGKPGLTFEIKEIELDVEILD